MNPTELSLNRRNTTAFIGADPVEIALFRPSKVDTPDGGYKMKRPNQANVAPQTFRLIPQSSTSDKAPELSTSTGRIVASEFVILCEWDADIERWDMLQLNGTWYEVASPIRPEHSATSVYERKADLVRREDA